MAKNLVKKGFDVTVFDLKEGPVEELKAVGAAGASSCKELAKASDVIMVMVCNDQEIQKVIHGRNEVWEGIRDGSTLIISSTSDPLHCQKIASEARPRGGQGSRCTGEWGEDWRRGWNPNLYGGRR